MDLDDLERKAANSRAKVLLLSHMRGKVSQIALIRNERMSRGDNVGSVYGYDLKRSLSSFGGCKVRPAIYPNPCLTAP